MDIAGGASTVRQALAAGVVDELTLDIAPVLLGSGERIFDGVESSGWSPSRSAFAAGHAHPLPPGGLRPGFQGARRSSFWSSRMAYLSPDEQTNRLLLRARDAIDRNYERPLDIASLARIAVC